MQRQVGSEAIFVGRNAEIIRVTSITAVCKGGVKSVPTERARDMTGHELKTRAVAGPALPLRREVQTRRDTPIWSGLDRLHRYQSTTVYAAYAL